MCFRFLAALLVIYTYGGLYAEYRMTSDRIYEEDCVLYLDAHENLCIEISGCEFFVVQLDHNEDCKQCKIRMQQEEYHRHH